MIDQFHLADEGAGREQDSLGYANLKLWFHFALSID